MRYLTTPRRSSGFTLIELLIVVAIIAILAAIAVPNFLEAQVRAKVSRARTDLRSVATALESYRVDYNQYPNTPFCATSFNGGLLRVIPNTLSTPIAYITTASLQDPFMVDMPNFFAQPDNLNNPPAQYAKDPGEPDTEALDPLGGRRFYYTSNDDKRRQSLRTGASLASFLALEARIRTFEGYWVMASLGPNKKRDLETLANLPESNFMQYDPTNGTVSDGMILRTQKDGVGNP